MNSLLNIIMLGLLWVIAIPLWIYDSIIEAFTGRKPYE